MPISITRVYTRLGDRGETALVGGRRVAKDSPRIVAYGTVDELNAVVGLVRAFNAERMKTRGPRRRRHAWLDATLRKIQNQLFDVGSELATPADAEYEGMFKIGAGEVTELEKIMDESSRSARARSATSTGSAICSSCSAAGSASTWASRNTSGSAASARTAGAARNARSSAVAASAGCAPRLRDLPAGRAW